MSEPKNKTLASLRFQAPEELRDRILRDARDSADLRPLRPLFRAWLTAASACAALLVAVVATHQLSVPSTEDAIVHEIVGSHVRSLMVSGHLIDVPSSDRHTVKPWFNGKLDFSPVVGDFAEEGFKLVGGRLDYVGSRPVAALVYQVRQHVINLLTWPSGVAGETEPTFTSRQGYSIFHWVEGGMAYWVVSDLNGNELKRFSELVKAQAAGASVPARPDPLASPQ